MHGLEKRPPHGDRISTVGQSAVPDQGEGAGRPKKNVFKTGPPAPLLYLRSPFSPPPSPLIWRSVSATDECTTVFCAVSFEFDS